MRCGFLSIMTNQLVRDSKLVDAQNFSDMVLEALERSDKFRLADLPNLTLNAVDEMCRGQTLVEGEVSVQIMQEGYAGAEYAGYQDIWFEIARGRDGSKSIGDMSDLIYGTLEVYLETEL